MHALRSGLRLQLSRPEEKRKSGAPEEGWRGGRGEAAHPSTHLPGLYLGTNLGSADPGAKPKYLNSKSQLELVNSQHNYQLKLYFSPALFVFIDHDQI